MTDEREREREVVFLHSICMIENNCMSHAVLRSMLGEYMFIANYTMSQAIDISMVALRALTQMANINSTSALMKLAKVTLKVNNMKIQLAAW